MFGTGWATSHPECMERLRKHYSHFVEGWFLVRKAAWVYVPHLIPHLVLHLILYLVLLPVLFHTVLLLHHLPLTATLLFVPTDWNPLKNE